MKDGTRELTNNQWLLKADADKLPATYAELVTLLTGAGLPFGRTLLSDGWTIEPDPLNKANLLKDVTAALYNLPTTAVPDDAFKKAAPKKLIRSYTTAGTYTWTAPDRNGDGSDYEIFVIVVGGGGSGSVWKYWATAIGYKYLTGGGSGYSKQFKLTVTPGNTYAIVAGAGGTAVTVGSTGADQSSVGNNGNSSSFNGITANGGSAGALPAAGSDYICSKGGRPSDSPSSVLALKNYPAPYWSEPANGDRSVADVLSGGVLYQYPFVPADCINQVTGDILLAAGGSVICSDTGFAPDAQTTAVTINGCVVGNAACTVNVAANLVATTPTLPGAGGGSCANIGTTANTTYTAKSGKGVDGAVMIYS